MVTASRKWVCVRPATYESLAEAKVLMSYFPGREGTLENTVFALLDSKGKMISYRAGRTPGMLYDSPAEFAEALNKHGKKPSKSKKRSLPVVANLRLGLNVAACDSIPLVVAYSDEAKVREKLSKNLAEVAWNPELIGRVHYVVCSKEEFQAQVGIDSELSRASAGVLVLDPDDYGRESTSLAKLPASLNGKSLLTQLVKAVAGHEAVARDHRQHVRQGKRDGIEWKGEIETTDPSEKRRKRDR